MQTETQSLVGTHEILAEHGIPRHRVFRFIKRDLFPEPIAVLNCGAIFDAQAVRAAVERLRVGNHL